MKIRNFRSSVSGLAIILSGAMVQPAIAQSTAGAQDATADKPAASTDAATKDDGKPATQAIVVTARRKALEQATEIKKLSDTIVDSVVSDEAGKLPDTSVTEVLQRISGVTLSRFTVSQNGTPAFQVEGTGISVRGLPYNSSTLNGEQVFSANGASAISWGEVTPELMGGVDIYKASRADLIEGGVSSIDLRTHLPFDYHKTEFDVTAGGNYGDLSKSFTPNVSALYTKTFHTGIGDIGILWDVAYSRYNQAASDLQIGANLAEYAPGAPNNMALVPNGVSWSQDSFQRERYGAYQAIQWRPKNDLVFTNTVFFSQYITNNYSEGAGFGNTPSGATTNIPSNATYANSGLFESGNLGYGSTGIPVWGQNTWQVSAMTPAQLAANAWFIPYVNNAYNSASSPFQTPNCGATYGAAPSTATYNWGNWPNFDQCTPPVTGLPGFNGHASAGHSKNSTLNISQSVLWTPGDRLRLRGGVQFVFSRASSQSMYADLAQGSGTLGTVSINETTSIPTVGGLNTAGLLNPGTAYWGSMSYNGLDNKGTMLSGHVDVDYNLGEDGFFKSISAGVRVDNRVERDDFIGTYYADLGAYGYGTGARTPTNDTAALGNSADYTVSTFPNFFNGRVAAPGAVLLPSPSLMKSFNWLYLLSTYGQPQPNAAAYWNELDQGLGKTRSTIFNAAAYLETKFAHDRIGFIPPFSGNIGVRVAGDKLYSSGMVGESGNAAGGGPTTFYLTTADAVAVAGGGAAPLYSLPGTGNATQNTIAYGFVRVLPAFNIKFELSQKAILRFAASESDAPPNLGDIKANGNVSAATTNYAATLPPSTPGGSPTLVGETLFQNMFSNNGTGQKLRPVMIRSEDVSLEWYPKNGTMLYADGFLKQIKDQDLFSASTAVQPTALLENGTTPVTLNLPWTYLQNKTSGVGATIEGFEIGARTFFDMLPGVLKGFGVNGSLTFVESQNPGAEAQDVLDGNAPTGGTWHQDYKLPYYNMSKFSTNVELMYSMGPVNFRVAYNWHSKQLLSTNANPLSFAATGGNPYTVNTSTSASGSYQAYPMVPLWSDAAGYMDVGFDYKFSSHFSIKLSATNVLNTLSKTMQEPMPGVFTPFDTYMTDRRYTMTAMAHF